MPNKEEIKEGLIFLRFLKEKNLFSEWKKEALKCKCIDISLNYEFNHNIYKLFKVFSKENATNRIITSSMYWQETKRGHDYWMDIEREYRIYLSNTKHNEKMDEKRIH